MNYFTGVITNTRVTGTAASTVVVNTRNLSLVDDATIVVQLRYTLESPIMTPLYVNGYVVPAGTVDIREFSIAGVFAYELQINVISPSEEETVLTVFGLDESGNLVQNQRVLQSEFTVLPAVL
ncbi:hypothetical protein CEF21_08710 [Bacillus sp. FJAT-42376]|uniref:hypothetical protein n=1 Tax=Bacillus sp. FJAT-42376 TaxID=2014076 RepID=UPI000F50D3AD|nr:hypothetical protein [Bacillus sp. FJAT-42376]AZB42365.1 hypothetical protein CEF21_08710 [Bacillus sp. FJAT-42376]